MLRKILFAAFAFMLTVQLHAQTVNITTSGAWLESAYVQWEAIDSAQSYQVFYSGEGLTNKQIDGALIRTYADYMRADALGLAAGEYTLKVLPVFSATIGDTAVTGAITVEAHDRSGFAFANDRVPGAYRADGTPKSNAVVLYITENSKDVISLNVTGATSNPCVGLQTILEGFKKGDDTRPLIIRLVGQITDPAYLNKGDIVIENDNNTASYITLEGVGEDAVADGWGIRIKNATNIEIRNIATMNCNSSEGDNIGLQQNNDYIWIHHNDFFYGDAGSDSDQAKGDGALDCKKSTYVTFSYNHFWDSGKSNLLGLSEDDSKDWYITYHHNWYDHSDSRHPRVRIYSAHIYNNYYDGNSKYGVGSTMGSSLFVEGNYFRHCKFPILTSMQGSDVFDEDLAANDYSDMPTFSKEDGGVIKAYNNYMVDQRRFVAYGDENYSNSTVDYDAYVVSSREETVPSTVVSAYGSNTYDNFDTDASLMYDYTVDSPSDARDKVMLYAGRVNGGDFTWEFDDATDDTSYDVDPDLKAALTNYTTSLLSIQEDSTISNTGDNGGDDGGDGGDDGGDGGDDGGTVIAGDEIHNFTTDGLSSSFYTISGNLSDSKGTVSYGDLTLTQCLKIESSTSISFSIAEEAQYTLVFNEGFSGDIKINGTSESISNGTLTSVLSAGTYEVTKGDVANLYYMSIAYASGSARTNIAEREQERLILYPNPVVDQLTLKAEQEIESVQLYNLMGVLIKSYGPSEFTLDMGAVASGSYLLVVVTENGIQKELIQKK